MERLLKAGLVGRGLIPIDTPQKVARYNEALERLGITPTSLTEFSIDGIGWSPEVMSEKVEKGESLFYLSAGGTNQFAIVFSPDQKGKPIYLPFVSYLRRLMKSYFDRYQREIADVTTTHAITLMVDPEVSRYKTPLDFMYVDKVIVRSDAANLFESRNAQVEMVEQILAKGDDGWSDDALRHRLIDHAKAHGDLRYRNVHIQDYPFETIDCFFTEGFGGVYVLRSEDVKTLILVGEDSREYRGTEGTVIGISSPRLPELLIEEGWADVDLGWYGKHQELLQDMRECLINTLILEVDPSIPIARVSNAHKQSILGNLESEKLALLEELEWLAKRLEGGKATRKGELRKLSPRLTMLLLRPKGGTVARRETVERLLASLRSHDPLEMYRADKNRFMREYGTWSREKREWAAKRIADKYVPEMGLV